LRSSLLVVLLSAIIILSLIIPEVSADTMVFIDEEDNASPIPAVFGNSTEYPLEDSMCFSVTDEGFMFMVGYCSLWSFMPFETSVSLIAWGSDGTIMWSHTWGCLEVQLFGLTNDGECVYVTGRERGDIFVGKYDFQGQQVWNKTIDLGEIEVGMEIGVLDDRTIIIGGYQNSEPEPGQIITESILLALDQGGSYSWHKTYEEYPKPLTNSNYVYISYLNTFQKLDSSGDVVLFVENRDSQLCCVRDEMLYTYREYTTNYTFTNIDGSTFEAPLWIAELDILSWNTETAHPLSMNNIKFCDYSGQIYNRTELHTEVSRDGSLKMLFGAHDIDKWYLSSISQTTELSSCKLLLNGSWQYVLFDMDDSGNVYLAADSRTYGLTVMRFDSAQLALAPNLASTVISAPKTFSYEDLLDIRLVGITAIGVTLFDVIFIIYLKRSMTK
jgi:hypothetical protein